MPHSDTVYFLINKQTGTAVDLDITDLTTVAGYPRNGQDIQKWRFTKRDEYWIIQNVSTDKYLDVERAGSVVENNDKVIAVQTDHPVEWEVRADASGDGWQIAYNGTNKVVDLYGGGAEPGTPIVMWDGWVNPNQVWRFEEVA